jgi:tape measure domain-containing protein
MDPNTQYIITALRVEGQAAYVSAMKYASTSVRDLESQQTRTSRAAKNLGASMDTMSNKAYRAGGRIASMAVVSGAGLAKLGLQWDAMIERSQIGIGTLVGSAKQARGITADVQKFALEAPLFGTDQMIKTAQQLIGAGYDAKNIVPYLRTFSDTLSAMGRRPEDLQRMTYAFVQMMSKGQISAEELRGQLGEIFPAQKLLAKEMGISADEFAKKMKKGTFKGKESIMLLLRGMEKEFGGATSRMATTFDGQLANIRESAKFSLGVLFKPLFIELEKRVFPALSMFGDHATAVMQDSDLTNKEKWRRISDMAKAWLLPIWNDWMDKLDEMKIGEKIGKLLEQATPVVAEKMGKLASEAIKQFGIAWWNSGVWGKLFLTSIFLSKVPGWKNLFGWAGTAAGKKFGRNAAASTVATEQLSLFGASGTKAGNKWGKAAGLAGGAMMSAGIILAVGETLVQVNKWIKEQDWYKPPGGKDGFADSLIVDSLMPKKPKGKEKQSWWEIIRGGPAAQALFPTHKKDERFDPLPKGLPSPSADAPKLGAHSPFATTTLGRTKLGSLTINNYTVLDKRIVAKSVATHNFNEMSRK